MFLEVLNFLGPWTWVIFGLILLAFEIAMPSTFLLWPGLAALVVGANTLVLGYDNPLWPWQAQLLVFLLLSLVIAYVGRQYLKSRNLEMSEQPNLNERGAQMIGRTAVLTSAIENGEGRVKLGDSTWSVRGPEAEAGATVRIVGYDGSILIVETA